MPRITNSDQIAHLLRARLQKMNARAKSEKTSPGEAVKAVRHDSVTNLAGLLKDDLGEESEIREIVVRHFLSEEFGEDFATHYEFADLVRTVTIRLSQDDETDRVFRDAIAQIRSETL